MRTGLLALAAIALCACGAPKDEPDKDNVASSLEWAYRTHFIPEMGERLVVHNWDKLTYECTPVEGVGKRLECVTGGEITVRLFLRGVEVNESPLDMPPDFDLEFEKREEGWVVSRMWDKANRMSD